KLFGEDWQNTTDVIGQQIRVDHRKDFVIRGVVENTPDQSTIQFDVLLSIEDFFASRSWVEHWGNNGFLTYAQLDEEASLALVNEKIEDTIMQYWDAEKVSLFLQPFGDAYLYSKFEGGEIVGGRIEYVRIFSIAGLFLLLIASINFINLATARSLQRTREIGIRKAIGAQKHALFTQFLGESILIAILSAIIAIGCVFLLMPAFNMLAGKQVELGDLDPAFFIAAILITGIVGLLAGGYPALYLSGFNPLQALRNAIRQRPYVANLRKGLIVLQFTLSVLLIVGTLVVYLQIQFIEEMDMGLDRENVIYIAQEGVLIDQYDAIRDELLKRPGISEVTSTTSNPMQIGSSTGDAHWEGKNPNDEHEFYIIGANFHFVELMDMEIIAGRSFSDKFGRDSTGFIVNEKTAALIGDDVQGKELSFWGQSGPILGVVKNFEMNSIYSPTEPVIIQLDTETDLLYIKSHPGQTELALSSLEEVTKAFNPDFPFDYGFLDQDFEQTYRSESVLGQLAFVFACIAIFVSCLGLLGLISFTTKQRRKEIGVRKVLGASNVSLVGLLTKEITLLVLAGIGFAFPLSYTLVSRWLSEFEHYINLSPTLFVSTGLLAIAIAWTTVSFQSIKAALENPARTLRHE
ncbi:MAG: FtsX-like permease family protein, partial [Chloroflexota bacterium]